MLQLSQIKKMILSLNLIFILLVNFMSLYATLTLQALRRSQIQDWLDRDRHKLMCLNLNSGDSKIVFTMFLHLLLHQ